LATSYLAFAVSGAANSRTSFGFTSRLPVLWIENLEGLGNLGENLRLSSKCQEQQTDPFRRKFDSGTLDRPPTESTDEFRRVSGVQFGRGRVIEVQGGYLDLSPTVFTAVTR